MLPSASAHVLEAMLAGIAARFGLGHSITAAEAVKLLDEELEHAELRPDSPAAAAVLSTTAAMFIVTEHHADQAWYTAALQILLLAGADLDTARRVGAARR